MPKPKPDEVIRHEVVLGRSERDLLSGMAAAYEINRVLDPFVEILKDASALLAIAGILEALGFTDFIPDEYLEAIRAGAAGGLGAINGMIDTFADALDDAQDAADELILEVSQLPQEVQDAITGAAAGLNPFSNLSQPITAGALIALTTGQKAKRKGAKLWAWLTTQANRLDPPAMIR
jgi:hypothetical protein